MTQGSETTLVSWPAGERVVSTPVADAILAANALSISLAEQLNGFRIPRLPEEMRVQLSSACFHIAMEHHQSLNTLIIQWQYGSALALLRPTIEACFRGHWLMMVASSDELEAVGRDARHAFPSFTMLVRAIENSSDVAGAQMSDPLRGPSWGRLCSYTHTGYQQIGVRLTVDGLGADYTDEELLSALTTASVAAIMSAASLAALGGDDALATTIAARLSTLKSQ